MAFVATPGRGYALMEGYFLPPLSFGVDEAMSRVFFPLVGSLLTFGYWADEKLHDWMERKPASAEGEK